MIFNGILSVSIASILPWEGPFRGSQANKKDNNMISFDKLWLTRPILNPNVALSRTQ